MKINGFSLGFMTSLLKLQVCFELDQIFFNLLNFGMIGNNVHNLLGEKLNSTANLSALNISRKRFSKTGRSRSCLLYEILNRTASKSISCVTPPGYL